MRVTNKKIINKTENLMDLLNELKNNDFTGFIRINFSQGGITKIEKTEDILDQLKHHEP
jgi:5,10-methylenetetrahydrofolate reductase